MTISDDMLMAYADGELEPQERARLDAALAQDESLRQRLAAHQSLRARVSAAFDGALAEPVPEALTQAVAPPSAAIIDLSARRVRWSMREWGAMAASIAAGLVVGVGLVSQPRPLIATDAGALMARGALAQALETQLAADDAELVRIGLSFRDDGGAYCRSFDLIEAHASGLACRTEHGWRIAMTADNPQTEIRTASASAAIYAAIEARIQGEPLDAEAEAKARSAGWR